MAIIGSARYGINGYGSWREHPGRDKPGNIFWYLQIDLDGDGYFDSRVLPPSFRAVEFFRGVQRRDDPRGFGASQPEEEFFLVEIVDLDGDLWGGSELSSLVNMTSGRMARLLAVSSTTRQPAETLFTGTLSGVELEPQTHLIRFRGCGMVGMLIAGKAADVRDRALAFNAPESEPFLAGSGAPTPIRHWRGQSPGTGATACGKIILEACDLPLGLSAEEDPQGPVPEFFTLTGGSAWNALKAVCAAFALRAEFQKDGSIHLRRLAFESARPFSSGAELSLEYAPCTLPAPGIYNQIHIRVRPLHCPLYTLPIPFGEYGVAWSAAGPLAVPPAGEVVLDVRFRKTEGSVFAANFTRVNSDSPLETEALTVNSQPDKSGINLGTVTGSGEGVFELIFTEVDDPLVPYPLLMNYGGWQDQARLRLRNANPTQTAYFFNLRLYAAGLCQRVDTSLVEVGEEESQNLFGQRAAILRNPLIQDPHFAEWAAREYLNYFREPLRATVTRASRILRGDTILSSLLTLEPGSLVSLPENNPLAVGVHRVLGTRLRWLNPTGQHARQEVWLEKAPAPRVTVDSSASFWVSSQSSAQWQHSQELTQGAYLLVAVTARSWGWTVGVTADGNPLSLLTSVYLGFPTNGDHPRVELWGAPADQGLGNINVQFDSADWGQFASLLIKGVDPQAPISALLEASAFEGNPLAEADLSEGDLLVCAAGFQQYDPPVCAKGTALYNITSDGNWRGAVAFSSGLRSASVGWSGVTGGYALAGVLLKALWHHNNL